MDSQAQPLPHGLSWLSPLCSVRFPRDIPFFDPAGMLVDFDRGAVQHQRCFVHQILLNQGCEDIFPYSSFCPGTEPAGHTLPWPEPFRQLPPWYSGVQPIQDCVEHFPVAFSSPASLRLFFRWKLVLDTIPLFFTDFMSFHVLYFTISALYTQYLSFQTDSSRQFKAKLDGIHATQSMSRPGRCIDNGPMEGFWGILKSEMCYLQLFHTFKELEKAIDEYIVFTTQDGFKLS